MLHGVHSTIVLCNGWSATVQGKLVCHDGLSEGDAPSFIFWGSFYLILHVLQTFLQMLQASEPLWRHFLGLRASASGGGATRKGAATDTCSRRAAATTCWIALSKAGGSSSVEVSEEVLRRGRSATGSVTLGGRDAGGRAAGVEPVTPGSEGAPVITCRA
ncbi:UNVERIFIED_CONTAM: hypothetical protein Slati_1280300 [Sesamum latifolium]|uniref:Uncharacterized protein n=1 Tax=Sesamum latifolium TaxID=2727402 RepID=A0AAW2XGA6_9LAMI